MKSLSIIVVVAIVLSSVAFTLYGISVPNHTQEREFSRRIVKAHLGDKYYYIPKEYLKFSFTSVGKETALLQAWYPGADIVPGDNSTQLWKEGDWWKNVRVLLTIRKNDISFDEFSTKSTDYLEATEFVGNQYGLEHYAQPTGTNQDRYDVWFEKRDGHIRSYITCSEKISEHSQPKCRNLLFYEKSLLMKITYDLRLLPEWKEIQNNVLEMVASFSSREAAQEFLLSKRN